MATKKQESKPSAQAVDAAPATATVVEFVLRDGKQGVFSHSSEAAVRAKYGQCVASDFAQGRAEGAYSITEKTVVYELPEGVTELPTGEESQGLKGTVKERKLSL